MADARHEFVAASVGLVHLRSVPVISEDGGTHHLHHHHLGGGGTSFKALTRRNSKAGYYRALSGVSFQSSVDVMDTVTPADQQSCISASPSWASAARDASPPPPSSASNPIRVTFIQRVVTDYCAPEDDGDDDDEEEHRSASAPDDEHIYDTVEELGTDVSDSDLSGLDLAIFEPGKGSAQQSGGSSSSNGGAQKGFIYRPPRPERRPVRRSQTFRERLKKNLLPKLFNGSNSSSSNAQPEPPAVDYDEDPLGSDRKLDCAERICQARRAYFFFTFFHSLPS